MIGTSVGLRHDLRPGDLGQIIQLHGTIYARDHGFSPLFEADIAGRLAEFAPVHQEENRLWIAERAGRIVGCIAVVGLSPKDAQLRWFVVDPLARGLGLGERLLCEAVEFCARCGYECVFLGTIQPTKGMAELYRSVGFEKVGESHGERWGAAVIEETYALYLGEQRDERGSLE